MTTFVADRKRRVQPVTNVSERIRRVSAAAAAARVYTTDDYLMLLLNETHESNGERRTDGQRGSERELDVGQNVYFVFLLIKFNEPFGHTWEVEMRVRNFRPHVFGTRIYKALRYKIIYTVDYGGPEFA